MRKPTKPKPNLGALELRISALEDNRAMIKFAYIAGRYGMGEQIFEQRLRQIARDTLRSDIQRYLSACEGGSRTKYIMLLERALRFIEQTRD
jgi:hypothetical protein